MLMQSHGTTKTTEAEVVFFSLMLDKENTVNLCKMINFQGTGTKV